MGSIRKNKASKVQKMKAIKAEATELKDVLESFKIKLNALMMATKNNK